MWHQRKNMICGLRMPATAKIGPTAIDLFSGMGGLSLGLRQAGFNVIGAIEIDPVAVETYRANHKSTCTWTADIREMSPALLMSALRLRRGELDLLAGCPPCQGFSSLRTRRKATAVDDPRNDLVAEFGRFAIGLLPRIIMMENVPGLARDPRFLVLVRSLRRNGYSLWWDIVDAAAYGVPQRRSRLILLGARGRGVAALSAGVARPIRTVRAAIGRLPPAGSSGDPLHDAPEHRSTEILSLISAVPKDGGGRRDVTERTLPCHRRCDGFGDVYGRMAWDDVAPTITSGCHNPSKGRFLHPSEDRAITLREAAILQSFPRRYSVSLKRGKEHAALMIGNALPPRLIRHVARHLRDHLY